MTTATWVGGSGNWSDPIHWSGATGTDGTPDPDQDVVIPAFSGQSVIVTLDTPAVINSISITGDSLLNTTTLALGDNMISVISEDSLAFSLNENAAVTLAGGGICDNGGLVVAAGASVTGFGSICADGLMSGGGTITASGGQLELVSGLSNLTLAIDSGSSLLLDASASINSPITIDDASQTLEIGATASLDIVNGVQTVTNGTIRLDGGQLSDTHGIDLASGQLIGAGSISTTGTSFEGGGKVTAAVEGDATTLRFLDQVDSTTTTEFHIADRATLAFEKMVGNNSKTPTITFDTGSGEVLDLTDLALNPNGLSDNFFGEVSKDGFTSSDFIKVSGATSVSLDGASNNVLTVFNGSENLGAITFTGDMSGDYFHIVGGNEITICFMPGTLIQTPDGGRAVETLEAGDLVSTMDGRVMPVRWIGRQTVSRIFGDPMRVLPIRIKQGALGENLPERDLLVSPDHALLINDVLVQAGALVNGASIMRETNVPSTYTYYHVELDDHSLILAEGVPAETFVDNIDRLAFDNWDEHEALYPNGKVIVEMQYPRAKSFRQVPPAIRSNLAIHDIMAIDDGVDGPRRGAVHT
jgi:Hint domain